METVNLIEEDLRKYPHLKKESNVSNTEGDLYLKDNKVLKLFIDTPWEKLYDKLNVIKNLMWNKEYITAKELVLPQRIVKVDKEEVGYEMPYIKGINLSKILYNQNLPVEYKLDCLKKIGTTLRSLENVRHNLQSNFFINDLHEDNIIFDKEGQIHFLDLDSCYINESPIFPSMYLMDVNLSDFYTKYKLAYDNTAGGMYIPNNETDLYCYSIIILDFLTGWHIASLSKKRYETMLNYLNDLGLNKELLTIFANLRSNNSNVNPDYLLDAIKEIYPQSTEFGQKIRKR